MKLEYINFNKKIPIILFFLCNASFSDEIFKFVESSCVPKANYFKLESENIYNIAAYKKDSPIVKEIEAQSSLEYVSAGDTWKKDCTLSDKKISIDLQYRKPTIKGECGSELRANLSLNIDGIDIMKGARFHSNCFSYSLKKLDFRNIKYGSFMMCGRYTNRSPYKKSEVCSNIYLSSLTENKILEVELLLKNSSSQ